MTDISASCLAPENRYSNLTGLDEVQIAAAVQGELDEAASVGSCAGPASGGVGGAGGVGGDNTVVADGGASEESGRLGWP